MGKNNIVFLFFVIGLWSPLFAQQQTYLVSFTDKNSNNYSLSSPEQFLTARAIQRRQRCGVSIDQKDLPVTQSYVDQLTALGAQVLYPLKWFNAAVVRSDTTVKNQIEQLSFVSSTDRSVKSRQAGSSTQQCEGVCKTERIQDYSFAQNNMLGMVDMRNDGWDGSGILIAITDDGFLDADTMTAFAQLFASNRILNTWDIVGLDQSVYGDGGGHGTHVFSILAGSIPGQLTGPATGASFILFRTEDISSESPLEELNWVRAAEMADSMGADILQVSLGYNTFDDSSLDYTLSDLDGKTSYSSRGAELASSRGMVAVISAGNAGNSSWGKILCPSDADGVLAVGAVDANRERGGFSSFGYSADGRVKPDVMAMGVNVAFANSSGGVSVGSGTSFASPLVSGLAAGILQAHPTLTHTQLMESIRYSADRYNHPDPYYGYGIPSYHLASGYVNTLLSDEEIIFPNPFGEYLYAKVKQEMIGQWLDWKLYTTTGKCIAEGQQIPEQSVVTLFASGNSIPSGIYCLRISYNGRFSTYRVIK